MGRTLIQPRAKVWLDSDMCISADGLSPFPRAGGYTAPPVSSGQSSTESRESRQDFLLTSRDPSCPVLKPCSPTPKNTSPVVSTRQFARSEEHTSELQSHSDLVCRLLLEKK